MKTEGTNLHLLTISAFWSLATLRSSRRQRSIPLGGRYRQVSLYNEPVADNSSNHQSSIHKQMHGHTIVCQYWWQVDIVLIYTIILVSYEK